MDLMLVKNYASSGLWLHAVPTTGGIGLRRKAHSPFWPLTSDHPENSGHFQGPWLIGLALCFLSSISQTYRLYAVPCEPNLAAGTILQVSQVRKQEAIQMRRPAIDNVRGNKSLAADPCFPCHWTLSSSKFHAHVLHIHAVHSHAFDYLFGSQAKSNFH